MSPVMVSLLRRLATAVALTLGVVSLAQNLLQLRSASVYEKDFGQDYVLARAILDGADPYVPVRTLLARYIPDGLPPGVAPGEWGFVYPTPHSPQVGLLFIPLSLFDYRTAATIWWGLEIVLLIASVRLMARAMDVGVSWWGTLGLTIVLIAWSPVRQDLLLGQLMIPMLALLGGTWLALRSGRAIVAGALLGLALVLKPVIWLLLVVLALRRKLRAVAAAMAVAMLSYVLAGVVIGFGTIARYWFEVLPTVSRYDREWGRNFAPAAIIETGIFRSDPGAVAFSLAIRSLVVLVGLVWLRQKPCHGAWLGAAICLNLLVNPVAWDHYLVLAAIPAAYVARNFIRHRLSTRQAAIALVTALLLAVPVGPWIGWVNSTVAFALVDSGYIVGLGLLALLAAKAGSDVRAHLRESGRLLVDVGTREAE